MIELRAVKMPKAEDSKSNADLEQQVDLLVTPPNIAKPPSEPLMESTIAQTERLTLALDAAQMGCWDLDLATGKSIWNTYHEIIFGYEPGTPERDYFDWERLIHPDDLERIHQATHYARDHHTDLAIQYRIIWPDGSLHWINASGRFYYGADGQPVRMLGVLTDITDLKRNEESLRRSEAFNRQVLDRTEDCIKILDLEGRLLYMNEPGQRIMEVDNFETYKNIDWLNFWDLESHGDVLKALETARQGGVYKFQASCSTAKGTFKWWDVVISPILNAKGTGEQLLVISRDVTERWRTEQVLRESEERFRVTFEQAAVGVAHVDLDGRWLRVNQTLCNIVGYTREELVSKTFQDITYPEDLDFDLENVRQLLAGETESYTLEKRYRRKDGQLVWVNLTASLLRQMEDVANTLNPTKPIFPVSGLGQPKYFICIIEDICDRKQVEQTLQQRSQELTDLNTLIVKSSTLLTERNQELDRFVYIVSHDLKAPLRGIANLAEWIEDDLAEKLPAENQQQLALMRSRVTRMDAMINGLLEYSRAGHAELRTELIDIPALLAEILDLLEIPPGFKIKIEAQVESLRARRVLLNQVLLNLISNALKHHNHAEGTIQIGVRDLGKYYEFWVQDDGPGIPPEHHQRIFEIFQTLNSSNESTGIGLSIVKKIIEAEGGTLQLTSEVDVGSKFSFTWLKEISSEVV
jgi:PAS domain S-box-containing protein